MKKFKLLLLIATCILFVAQSLAQTIVWHNVNSKSNLFKKNKIDTTELSDRLKHLESLKENLIQKRKINIDEHKDAYYLSVKKLNFEDNAITYNNNIKQINKAIDETRSELEYKISLLCNKSDDSINVQILGVGGITDVQTIEKCGANATFGIALNFGGHKKEINKDEYDKLCCNEIYTKEQVDCPCKENENKEKYYKARIYQRNTIYAYWNTRTGNSADSQVLAKTFLFPEISNRDITIGYKRKYSLTKYSVNSDFTWVPYLEFSTSHFDSGENYFRTYSGAIGCTFDFSATTNNAPIGLSFTPYFNLLSVDPKYNKAFDSAFHLNPFIFRTVGLNVVGKVSTFQIFANIKYVFNKNIENIDLKGLNFTIGLLVNTDIWNFNVAKNE